MLEIMAVQQKAKASATCSRCQGPAVNHCATCEMFMCKKCSELHDFWPGNKSHKVISAENLGNPESQGNMSRKIHSQHSQQLQSSCTTLDEKLSEGKEALNSICEVMKSLEKNAKTAKDQIKEQKENILKIVAEKLEEKAEKMNKEVDEVYGELHSELSKQHDEIKDWFDKVQASVSLPRNLLKRGSIEEILSSQKLIDESIKKLRNEQPENLVAVNDGSLQYVPDDIGNIRVDEIVDKLGYVEGLCNLLYLSTVQYYHHYLYYYICLYRIGLNSI